MTGARSTRRGRRGSRLMAGAGAAFLTSFCLLSAAGVSAMGDPSPHDRPPYTTGPWTYVLCVLALAAAMTGVVLLMLLSHQLILLRRSNRQRRPDRQHPAE